MAAQAGPSGSPLTPFGLELGAADSLLGSELPTLMDVMGEGLGLDDFFSNLGEGTDSAIQRAASQSLHGHGHSHTWPVQLHGSDYCRRSSGDASQASGNGVTAARTPSGNSFGGAPPKSPEYDQLLQMQQQLQALQASVTAKLQHLQQVAQPQQPQAPTPQTSIPPAFSPQAPPLQAPQPHFAATPEVQEMQRMLEHVNGVLAQSQEQQIARSQRFSSTFTSGNGAVPSSGAPGPSGAQGPSGVPGVPLPSEIAPTWLRGAQPEASVATQQQPTGKRGKARGRPMAELERQLEEKQAEAEALVQRNIELKRRQRMLGNFIRVRETQMHRLQQVKAQGVMAFLSKGPAAAAAKKSPMLAGLTEEHMKSMDIATSNTLFTAAVQEVSRLLGLAAGATHDLLGAGLRGSDGSGKLGSDHCTKEEAAAELEVLVKGLTEAGYVMMLLHPSFAQIKYEGCLPGGPPAPPPDHWQQVAAAVIIGDEQMQELAVLHDIHRSLSSKLYRQRQQLVLQMQQLLEGYSNNVMDVAARQSIQTLADKLHRSVQQERCILFLTTEVFDGMLTADQAARLVVASYPFKPDELAILGAALKTWRQGNQAKDCQPAFPGMPVITTS